MKSRKRLSPAIDIEGWLVPGGGKALLQECGQGPDGRESRRRRELYSLVSSISAAIRVRAEDQSRSTDRPETPSASAVSAVVRPAK